MFSRVPPPKQQQHPGDEIPDHADDMIDSAHSLDPQHSCSKPPVSESSEEAGDDIKPKHVPSRLWEKFKALEKRTDDVTRYSTERRMKHLKRQIVETVQEKITHPDDMDILRAHDVKFGPRVVDPATERRGKGKKRPECEIEDVRTPPQDGEEWEEVKQYLNVNSHLGQGTSGGRSKLELEMEEAVRKGDYSRADVLSDRLANREFGTKIAGAFDARDFVKRKKEEEATATAKKRKKLSWGFDHKQRWEMKSNM